MPSCETDEHAQRAARRTPTDQTFEIAASFLDAAGDASRLALLVVLLDGPRSVADIASALGRERSLVSHQLRILRVARLVLGVRQGKFIVYELFDAHARQFIDSALAHASHIGARGPLR